MKKTINRIARNILQLETLQARRSDRLDFRKHYVGTIKYALEAAYAAGFSRGIARSRPLIAAADGLISTIMAAREHWDTGALDEIEPATTDLLQRVEAAKKTLKAVKARAP
jgi:hypothetical protein